MMSASSSKQRISGRQEVFEMNGKRLTGVCVLLAVGGFGLLRMAPADELRPQVPSIDASNEGGGASSEYAYVGHNKCKKCHIKEYKSWEGTKMANALESLKPGNAVEAKTKHGLDPAKDYSAEAKCLKCHTTGHGHEGGYQVPAEGDKAAERLAKNTAGVGCEACHGPGSKSLDVFEEIFKSKRTYKVDELHAVGLTKMGPEACTGCHNEESPTFEGFDYEKLLGMTDQMHEKLPLKQRAE
jgi:hypothetical protein